MLHFILQMVIKSVPDKVSLVVCHFETDTLYTFLDKVTKIYKTKMKDYYD